MTGTSGEPTAPRAHESADSPGVWSCPQSHLTRRRRSPGGGGSMVIGDARCGGPRSRIHDGHGTDDRGCSTFPRLTSTCIFAYVWLPTVLARAPGSVPPLRAPPPLSRRRRTGAGRTQRSYECPLPGHTAPETRPPFGAAEGSRVRRRDRGDFGIGFHCCLDVQRVTQDDHGAQQGRLARIQAARILRRVRPVDADIQRLAEACDRRQRQACDQVGERRLLVLCRILGLNRGSRNPRPSGMTLSPMPTPPNCGPAGSTRVVRADVVGWRQAGSSSVLGSLEDPA